MNLVSRVRQQATEQPEKVAYHFMGKDTTYGEFEHTVGRFAKGLQDLGVEKGIMWRFYSAIRHTI